MLPALPPLLHNSNTFSISFPLFYMPRTSTTNLTAWPLVAVVGLTITGCTTPKTSFTSDAGRGACLERIATELPAASQKEKQEAYRQCLINIDQTLTELKETAEEQAAQDKAKQAKASEEEQSAWATPQEKIVFCKLNQDEMIALDRLYTRAYAQLLDAYKKGASKQQKEDLQSEINDIRDEIDSLIPERMRSGQPLIPNVLRTYKRCNLEQLKSP